MAADRYHRRAADLDNSRFQQRHAGGLADAINSAGLGVTAQVVNTGAPGAPFRLQITSNATGSAQAFSITSSLAGGTAPDFANNEIGPVDASGVTGTAAPALGGTYTGTLSQGYHFTVVNGGTVGRIRSRSRGRRIQGKRGPYRADSYAGQELTVADGISLSPSGPGP